MHELLQSVFEGLEQEKITYCIMRDGDRLETLNKGGEIDLLVQKNQLVQLRDKLVKHGFVRLPAWGHSPHNFFLAYHEDSDCWFKFDVVTEVSYGKPIQSLRTTLAINCLRNRRLSGPIYIPSPEDEFVTLLLHCVLDKANFAASRQQRLYSLRYEIKDQQYASSLLKSFWSPKKSWAELAVLIDTKNWDGLLSERRAVAARLASQDTLGTKARELQDRLLRKANHWTGSFRTQLPTVALLAPDGAGKSSLATSIRKSFPFPVRLVYMGLYQKGKKRSRFAHIPGLGFAGLIMKQWGRYITGRYYQLRRRLVLFDRYPYDALVAPTQNMGFLKQLRRRFLAYSCPPPDIVFFLDAPGKILYARKGEHSADFLEQQRQSYLKLQDYLPKMIVINAECDAEYVRRRAVALIWRAFLDRHSSLKVSSNSDPHKRDSIKVNTGTETEEWEME